MAKWTIPCMGPDPVGYKKYNYGKHAEQAECKIGNETKLFELFD